MRHIFKGAAAALAVTAFMSSELLASPSLPCEDYDLVMEAFEQQGTVYRGRAEGPNHRMLQIFENEATGKGMAILHDEQNNRACPIAFGFDYSAFAARSSVIPPRP